MDGILKYCQACLSCDRKLYAICDLEELLQKASVWELISVKGGLCWECHRILMKFLKFKNHIKESQYLLHNIEDANYIQPFSSLKAEINASFEFAYNFENINNEQNSQKNSPEVNKHSSKFDENQSIKVEFVEEYENQSNIKEETLSDNDIYSDNNDSDDDIYSDNNDADNDKDKLQPNTSKICKHDFKKIRQEKSSKDKPRPQKEHPEIAEKFTKYDFSEEELLKNREEKKNQMKYKKMPYKCNDCVLGFFKKHIFDDHVNKKHNEVVGQFSCPVCQRRFVTETLLARHKEKHYTCYRCKLCKYQTVEIWAAIFHAQKKHVKDRIEKIHCSCCDFIAKTPDELSKHTAAEHHVSCNECGEKFTHKRSLTDHLRRIHSEKREFICDICNKTFITKFRLESHLVTHNSELAQKLAYCSQCKVQFKNIYVYRNHLRNSAGHAVQSYECDACNKTFVSKASLRIHFNFYHLKKSQFRCDICEKIFISNCRLKNHKQIHHGASRTRDHACKVCGKLFYTNINLKNHELTHSLERKFVCDQCGDSFKQRPALYTHCRLVHGGGKRTRKQKASQ